MDQQVPASNGIQASPISAQAVDVANPIGAAVRNGFAAVATGHGEKFVPALSDIIAGLNGVSLVEPPEM